jgi:hypothetical protein
MSACSFRQRLVGAEEPGGLVAGKRPDRHTPRHPLELVHSYPVLRHEAGSVANACTHQSRDDQPRCQDDGRRGAAAHPPVHQRSTSPCTTLAVPRAAPLVRWPG